MEDFISIHELIKDNKVLEACAALKKLTKDATILDEILLQESKFNEYSASVRQGYKSDSQNSKTLTRIVSSVIQIANNVKKEIHNRNGERVEGAGVKIATDDKKESEKENVDTLYKEAEEYYADVLNSIGRGKRDTYNYCVYTLLRYKFISFERPEHTFPCLRIAQTLKIMYLLNYNNSQTEEALQEIMSYVERGKKNDTKEMRWSK